MESTLSAQALFAQDTTLAEEVDVRILEAALEQFVLVGIRRTSTDDIARRARVNRTTLYRRMGTKEQIVRAALLHEARRLLGVIGTEVEAIDNVTERIMRGFAFTVTVLREHPLLRQVLAADREDTLVWMTVDAGEIVDVATAFVTAQIQLARAALGLPEHREAGTLAAVLVRLVHSLVLTPSGPPDLTDADALRAFAGSYIQPLIGVQATNEGRDR